MEAALVIDQVANIEQRLPLSTASDEYPSGLTQREVEVLQQVAMGLTNAEVGDLLFISPRTVGQHLSSIYSKTGASSRAATTRWAIEHNLTGD